MARSACVDRNSQAGVCSFKAFSALLLCGSELGAKLYLSEAFLDQLPLSLSQKPAIPALSPSPPFQL